MNRKRQYYGSRSSNHWSHKLRIADYGPNLSSVGRTECTRPRTSLRAPCHISHYAERMPKLTNVDLRLRPVTRHDFEGSRVLKSFIRH